MYEYRRTHNCGELRQNNLHQQVVLSGWVHRRRDHGGLIFIDLRDRFGITQVVFDPQVNPDAHAQANRLRAEWVITIRGEVIPRAEGMVNPNVETGEIEIKVSELHILSRAKTPPFSICDERIDVNEDLRLRYRFLEIRRGEIQRNLLLRHRAMQSVRRYLDQQGFAEIQTPIMGKSTPEGARDYLVPSRVHPGKFYALPQSPQIFKQLLMVSGMERYFQIAPCFRDEDLRADRQPEFTQIDLEMSFENPDTLFLLIEEMITAMYQETLGTTLAPPFPRMSYQDAMDQYGTDKPDLRFGMKLVNLNDIAARSEFSVFLDQLKSDGLIKGLCVKGGADLSRKQIDEYTAFVGQFGVRGLAWMKCTEEGLASNIVKFFPKEQQQKLRERLGVEAGDLIFMVADQAARTNQALDHLRRKLGKDWNLIDPDRHEFLWVTDFPLLTWNAQEQRLENEHHPFTSPNVEDLALLDTDPLKVRSSSYDLVLNGYELGSGSQRIHDGDLQRKIFEVLQLSPEAIEERFGFFVDALQYGTPPHCGIALGFDRMMMILCGTDNIRHVIAFPKTQKASDLMMDAPSAVGVDQLEELALKIEPID